MSSVTYGSRRCKMSHDLIIGDASEVCPCQTKSTLKPSRLHYAVIVETYSRLIVEVFILRYVLGALVEKSRIQNDIRHKLNHLLLLQLRCNCGTEINFHWSGPRVSLASTLSLHRFSFSLSGANWTFLSVSKFSSRFYQFVVFFFFWSIPNTMADVI